MSAIAQSQTQSKRSNRGPNHRTRETCETSSQNAIKSVYDYAKHNVDAGKADFINIKNGNFLYYPFDPSINTLKGYIFNKSKKLVCNNIPHIFEESYENENIKKLNLDSTLSNYTIHPLIEGSCIRIWHDPKVPNSKQTGIWYHSTNRYINGEESIWRTQQLYIAKYLPNNINYTDFLSELNPEYIYYFWISKDDESKNIVSFEGKANCYFIFAQHRKWNKDIKDYEFTVDPNINVNYFNKFPTCNGYDSFKDIKERIDSTEKILRQNYTNFLNARASNNIDNLRKSYIKNKTDLKTFSGFFLINNTNGTCVKIVPNIFTEYRTIIDNEPTIFYRWLKIIKCSSEDTINKFIFINYDKLSQLHDFYNKFKDQDTDIEDLTIQLKCGTNVVIKKYKNYK